LTEFRQRLEMTSRMMNNALKVKSNSAILHHLRRGGRARLKALDSKSSLPERVTGVRIPPSPPIFSSITSYPEFSVEPPALLESLTPLPLHTRAPNLRGPRPICTRDKISVPDAQSALAVLQIKMKRSGFWSPRRIRIVVRIASHDYPVIPAFFLANL
jgi:hypothetical protein